VLILPLHRAPTRANFPWVTLALIVINVFVFAFLQSGDARAQLRALDYYAEHDLARWERPAFRDWLSAQPGARADDEASIDALDGADAATLAQQIQSAPKFLAALEADQVITAATAGHAEWRARRDAFDRLWDADFSAHWLLQFSQFSPRRMLGAMFLHGSVGHLIGNMLFLAVLGLLVEGALGHGLFLAVYLLGGFGSAVASLLWRWGEVGSALGASGAIAALMGAYCVLWGLRKVRFFWWFFVAFDYVKAPALILLPFWLGWEVFNLLWNRSAHIGFDAHAGGIICGALLALGVRALGWERRDFLDEEVHADIAADDRAALERARQHLGRLEIVQARALLEPIAARDPADLGVWVALYRCARYEPRMPRLREAARAVIAAIASTPAEARGQKAVYDDYRKAAPQLDLPAPLVLAMLRRWPALGESTAASAVLSELVRRAPSTPELAATCLALARTASARGERAVATSLHALIVDAYSNTPDADKARLLLSDSG